MIVEPFFLFAIDHFVSRLSNSHRAGSQKSEKDHITQVNFDFIRFRQIFVVAIGDYFI